MPKKKTAHAESRAQKKILLANKQFFENPIQVLIHPFWGRWLKELLELLIKTDIENLPDVHSVPELVNRPGHVLDYEEAIVLAWILPGFSELKFKVSLSLPKICRTLNFERILDAVRDRCYILWMDKEEGSRTSFALGYGSEREEYFGLYSPKMNIGTLVRNSIFFLQGKRDPDIQYKPGRKEFMELLIDLVRLIHYQPKFGQRQRRAKFGSYYFDMCQEDIMRLISTPFKNASLQMCWIDAEPEIMDIRETVDWSVSLPYLRKVLNEGKFLRVALLSETRPAERFSQSLRNYCSTRNIEFQSRRFPNESIDLNMEVPTVYMVESTMLRFLSDCHYFFGSTLIPLGGIKKAKYQR